MAQVVDMQNGMWEWLHYNSTARRLHYSTRAAVLLPPQEHMQRSAGANSGESSVDLMSYVEYQRNHR